MRLLNLLFNLNNFVSGNKGNENQPSNTTQARIVTETLLYFKHFYGQISPIKGERCRQALQPLLKHQPMRTLNQGLTTTPGTSCPALF